jgi:hypothetical protein
MNWTIQKLMFLFLRKYKIDMSRWRIIYVIIKQNPQNSKKYIYQHIYPCIYMCVYICIYIYVCMYLYIYMENIKNPDREMDKGHRLI